MHSLHTQAGMMGGGVREARLQRVRCGGGGKCGWRVRKERRKGR